MGIPTDIKPFVTTKLISPLGKLRAGLVAKNLLKCGMVTFLLVHFRARLGNEVLENLIEPLMGGIYGTDIDKLSLMSTFLKKRGIRKSDKGMKDEKNKRLKQRQLYPGAPKGQFKQFKYGLSSFIEALEQDVKNKRCDNTLQYVSG